MDSRSTSSPLPDVFLSPGDIQKLQDAALGLSSEQPTLDPSEPAIIEVQTSSESEGEIPSLVNASEVTIKPQASLNQEQQEKDTASQAPKEKEEAIAELREVSSSSDEENTELETKNNLFPRRKPKPKPTMVQYIKEFAQTGGQELSRISEATTYGLFVTQVLPFSHPENIFSPCVIMGMYALTDLTCHGARVAMSHPQPSAYFQAQGRGSTSRGLLKELSVISIALFSAWGIGFIGEKIFENAPVLGGYPDSIKMTLQDATVVWPVMGLAGYSCKRIAEVFTDSMWKRCFSPYKEQVDPQARVSRLQYFGLTVLRFNGAIFSAEGIFFAMNHAGRGLLAAKPLFQLMIVGTADCLKKVLDYFSYKRPPYDSIVPMTFQRVQSIQQEEGLPHEGAIATSNANRFRVMMRGVGKQALLLSSMYAVNEIVCALTDDENTFRARLTRLGTAFGGPLLVEYTLTHLAPQVVPAIAKGISSAASYTASKAADCWAAMWSCRRTTGYQRISTQEPGSDLRDRKRLC